MIIILTWKIIVIISLLKLILAQLLIAKRDKRLQLKDKEKLQKSHDAIEEV